MPSFPACSNPPATIETKIGDRVRRRLSLVRRVGPSSYRPTPLRLAVARIDAANRQAERAQRVMQIWPCHCIDSVHISCDGALSQRRSEDE
jgi:hypothetical protein